MYGAVFAFGQEELAAVHRLVCGRISEKDLGEALIDDGGSKGPFEQMLGFLRHQTTIALFLRARRRKSSVRFRWGSSETFANGSRK